MLQNFWQQTLETLPSYLPNLAAALAILIVGWFAAIVAGAIVRGALRRTTLDNRLAGWLVGEDIEVERIAGRIVYYLVMLFVLSAFFQALRLTVVTGPLDELLSTVAGYVPRVLAAAALFFGGWIVASVLRRLVSTALDKLGLDERIGDEVGVERENQLPLSKTLGEAVYWLVLLLLLPAALGILGVQGLLAPVQDLVSEVLGFLPNILAAGLIFAVGWFVARLVQRIVTNLLSAAGVDAFAEQVGLATSLGDRRLSGLIGLLLYVMILVPVLISSLQALQLDAVTVPATAMLSRVLNAVPFVFAAGVLLLVAYFVARLVADLITNLLRGAGFDNVLAHIGFTGTPGEGSSTPSGVVGTIIVVTVMLFATVEAAGLMGFEALAALLSGLIVFAADVILGLIVFGVGLYLARLVSETIAASGARQANVQSIAARVSITVLAAAMALRQMGLAEDIVNLAFGLVLGAIALAAAVAFGLGARDAAGRQVEQWVTALEANASRSSAPKAPTAEPPQDS
ncbi:MAG: mechanosensitive ion channel [Acidobacteria bacterium]|nr:mechanosensitive ion channel [Acidobacteriota bacterium]